MHETVFEVRDINKHFPGVHALRDVTFDLKSGEIHGLVGHNGAGKSTLMKVITGSYIPESGEMRLKGTPATFKDAKDAIDKGIGIVSQEGSLIPTYTGVENIFLGNEITHCKFVDNKAMESKALDLVSSFGLSLDLDQQVSNFSPANRKLIEIFKVVIKNPSIIIYDEPTAALSDKERRLLFELMKQQRDMGYGIIFISHYIDEVIEMSDRITVMRDGAAVGTVDGATATKQQIVHMMINKEQKSEYVEKHAVIGEKLIEVDNVSDGKTVKNASFYIRRGEVVGMFGTVGSGRTELLEMVFGARKMERGEICISGAPVRIRKVRDAIKHGICMIPEDRLTKALMLDESVNENLSLPFIEAFCRFKLVDRKKERAAAEKTRQRLNIRTPSIDVKVNSLSGGNKQKVSFGRWVNEHNTDSKLFVFDEPTEGVDVGARAEMYKIIVELAEQGAACLVISSDISEIMGLSDRVYVMRDGEIVDEISKDTPDLQHTILAASVG